MSTKYSGTPEGEMIKILASIENSLKSTAITKKEVTPAKGSAAATARAIQAEIKSAISPIIRPITQVADAAKSLRDTTIKLNRHLEVSRTRFTSLNDEMGKFLKKLRNNNFSPSDFDKSIVSTADGVGEALVDARKNVIKLNKTIDISASKFNDLNVSVGKFLENLNVSRVDTSSGDDGISKQFATNDIVQAIVDTKHVIQSGLKGFTEQSKQNTTSIIEAINKLALSSAQMAQRPTVLDTQPLNPVLQQTAEILNNMASTQPVPQQQVAPNSAEPIQQPVAPVPSQTAPSAQTQGSVDATSSATTAAADNAKEVRGNTGAMKGMQRMIGRYLITQARQILSMDRASVVVDSFAKAISAASQQFFALAAMGMGSVGNMYDLNVAALKAGMSVREYTEMLAKNMEFAARAGSIDNFDAITSANNDQLRELGIFGESSKRLQVTLAQVATTMGVTQKDIPNASSQLINVFQKLNKTVSMTANEFQEAMIAVSESNAFRSESAGLDAAERQARLVELAETYSLGRQMGLSADEANRLGKALLDQRKLTVKDRIKESANLMRLASLTNNTQMIPELQSLSMKRVKSPEETARYAELLGQLERDTQRGLENASQTQQLSLENALQQARGALTGDVDTIMQGTAKAQVSDQSNQKGNTAFGQHVGTFGQIVGRLGEIIQGAQKNEIFMPLMTGLAVGLSMLFSKQLAGMLVQMAKFARNPKLPSIGGGTPPPPPGGPKGTNGVMKSITSAIESIVSKFATLKDKIVDVGGKMRGLVSSTTSTLTDLGSSSINKLKGGVSALINVGKGAVSTISGTISNMVSALKTAGPINAMSKALPASLSGLFEGISRSAKFGTSALGAALKIAGGALKSIPLIGQLISAGIELFTGDLRDAFSPDGGFINGVASAILAIPYSLADLVVSGMEFIFGDSLLKPVRTVLDSLGAGVMYGVNMLVAGIAKGISWFTDFLPKDSGLRKTIDSWSQNATKVANDTKATLDRTMNGETLSSISKENKEKRLTKEKNSVPAQEQSPKPRRISGDGSSDPQSTEKLSSDNSRTTSDQSIVVLNAILNVLTEIRDSSKIQNADSTPLGINNSVSQLSKIGGLGSAQQRLLSNM